MKISTLTGLTEDGRLVASITQLEDGTFRVDMADGTSEVVPSVEISTE